MPQISLIADTGLQFYGHDPLNFSRQTDSLYFREWFDINDASIKLELAEYLPEYDLYVPRSELVEMGLMDGRGNLFNNNLTSDQINGLTHLEMGEDCFSVSMPDEALEAFSGSWLPMPYFDVTPSASSLGPINWCRMKLIRQDINGEAKYVPIILFDTRTDDDTEQNIRPVFRGSQDKVDFSICRDTNLIVGFAQQDWLDEYIKELRGVNDDDETASFPSFRYIAEYIHFIKCIADSGQLPDVRLCKVFDRQQIDIDLVLDLGNSRTCGLLVNSEDPKGFTQVKKLEMQDLSDPLHKYTNSFDMRLAFSRCSFGNIPEDDGQFVWPSIVRVGEEAKRLIYQAKQENPDGQDRVTNYSSPKRYLWDREESQDEWKLITLSESEPGNIYLRGVSEQFDSNGELSDGEGFGLSTTFSRRSLMTFVFLEILAQAYRQINSYDYRHFYGNDTVRRRLKRVVLTCPTGMPLAEQIELRLAMEEAGIVLDRFTRSTYQDPLDRYVTAPFEIIPSVKDLKKDLTQLHERSDWNYDEATCNQLVFLYSEISQRYLGNCKQFFDLYSRKPDKKTITIGSIDIGGGTTDLMISDYTYEQNGKTLIMPEPKYWESFDLAGDDLLREVIRKLIIEGRPGGTDSKISSIRFAMEERKMEAIQNRLNNFFGPDHAAMGLRHRQMRREFNTQVLIPVALHYLQLAQERVSTKKLRFTDIFPADRPQPNSDVLDYFEGHFGFSFTSLDWQFDLGEIEDLIEIVLDPLLRKISVLLFAYHCDFVLLSGRPSSLDRIEKIFLRHYPVSPDRLISINRYRVGTWYPFSDGNGNFKEDKPIVAVGAMIALLAGKMDVLPNFKIDTRSLIESIIPTTEYFGVYNMSMRVLDNVFISPEENNGTITAAALPMYIGSKRFNIGSYPIKPMYVIKIDETAIEQELDMRGDFQSYQELLSEKSRRINKLRSRAPFTIDIERSYNVDKEKLSIRRILDKDKVEVSPKHVKLQLKTIEDERSYWLDNGSFVLSIN